MEHSAELSRGILLAFGSLQSFTSAGLIFGFTALAEALRKQGEYSELCAPNEDTCAAQDLQYSLIYSIGSSAFFAGFALHGWLLDRYGPRFDSVFGTACIFLGTLLLAFSHSKSFDAFIPAFALIGFGGPGIHLAWFHLSNLFLQRFLVQSFIVGVFVTSAIVYVIFAQLLLKHVVDQRALFLGHSAWLCLIMLFASRLWPTSRFSPTDSVSFLSILSLKYSLKPGAGVIQKEMTHMDSSQSADPSTASVSLEVAEPSKPTAVELARQTLRQQVCSSQYLKLQIFMAVHSLRFNFYLGTSPQQLQHLTADHYSVYVTYLNLALPLGCVAVPLIGTLLQKSLGYGFLFCNATALVYGVFTIVPVLQLQFVTFVFFSLHRISLFSCLYSYVSQVFGFGSFGRITGLSLLVAAIVSLLQYPLAFVAERMCRGSFFYVDLAVIVLTVPPLFFVCRNMQV